VPVTIVVCALAPLVAGTEVIAGGLLAPGELTASRGQHEVRAKLGSYCVTSEPAPDGTSQAICADAAAPQAPPRPRLPVQRGDRVRLSLADRPDVEDDPRRITAALMRFRDNGRLHYLQPRLRSRSAGERAWTLRMPADVRKADAIYVFVRLEGGDASYIIGLDSKAD
jgi:hypothetical protein